MATFESLPTEILLSILDLVTQCATGPSVGHEAAWIEATAFEYSDNPFDTLVIGQDSPLVDIRNIQM
jgi:hypothetical protein